MEDNGSIVIYESEGGDVRLDVRLENGTVWLTQQQLVELYQSSKANISEHIKNIFEEAIKEMVHVVETYEPNPEDAKTYDHLFRNVYIKMYPKLQYLYKKIKQFTMVK